MNRPTNRMDNINALRLVVLTGLLAAIGLAPYENSTVREIIYLVSGFAYTIVLYIALTERPPHIRTITAFVILGVSSVFVFSTFLILQHLPIANPKPFIFIPPSIAGALITIGVLHFVWRLVFNTRAVVIVLSCILVASIISPILLERIEDLPGYRKVFYSLNNSLWWIAFTTGLLINRSVSERADDLHMESNIAENPQ